MGGVCSGTCEEYVEVEAVLELVIGPAGGPPHHRGMISTVPGTNNET